MPQGQATWESQGTGSKDFIVSFETEKNLSYEYRHQSILGKLSKPVMKKTVGQGQQAREIDVGQSAAVWSKEVTTGDSVRFTLEQQLRGAPTYGDSAVQVGDYLAYLHAEVFVNMVKTPAFPLQEEMSAQRVADVITSQESQLRNSMTMYLAEEYVLEAYAGILRGASPNLLAAKVDGGRAIDLGRGAGVQVSPQHALVAGNGFTSGVAGSAGFETNLVTDLGTLTDTASDYISREFIHNLRAALTTKKIGPISNEVSGGRAMWYAACDPDLMTRLTDPNSSLYKAWLTAKERGKDNPVFGTGAIELDDIMFFPDPWLKKFRPDISSGSLVWGTSAEDKRDFTPTSNIAPMIIFGNGALLEAHTGTVKMTTDTGFHGDNRTIGARVKQAFMRSRYIPKDGRTGINLEQGCMVAYFYEPGPSY